MTIQDLPTVERYQGCLLSLALGDAIGAPFEGGPLERLVWRMIGRTKAGAMRWTDDTQMAIDLAESLIAARGVDQDDLADRFAAGYRWSRGYGPGAAKLLKRIRRGMAWRDASRSVYRDGSYGNGGAMRAPMVGLYYAMDLSMVPDAARQNAEITHAHPLGKEGAVLIAVATAVAVTSGDGDDIVNAVSGHCSDPEFRERMEIAERWLSSGERPSPEEVAKWLGNGISATQSCITAVYLAVRFLNEPFEDLMDAVIRGKGDTDTIGAMAGAIWGAANGFGALPKNALGRLEACDRLKELGRVLYEERFTCG